MSQPIFISLGEGVTSSHPVSPILVKEGDSLDIVFTSTKANEVLSNVTLNGLVVANGVKTHTVKLTNITDPKFITAKATLATTLTPSSSSIAGSSIARDGSVILKDITALGNDSCCGIKSVRLALQEDGSVVGTVSGLESDVYDIMNFVMSGAPSASSETKYRITSWRVDGVITTLSAMSTVSDTYEKIETSAIFKTIPQDIYDMHISGVIPRSIQNPLESPDSTIYIRGSDIYGTDGWTVQEIFDILGIDATVPSGFNYHVYQLTVTRGTPVISLLHNLLPIPGLVIERRAVFAGPKGTIGSYYINIAKGRGSFSGSQCKVVSKSSKTTVYTPTIIGQLGEPKYIKEPDPAPVTPTLEYTLNLVKGVFSIDKTVTTSHTESIIT